MTPFTVRVILLACLSAVSAVALGAIIGTGHYEFWPAVVLADAIYLAYRIGRMR